MHCEGKWDTMLNLDELGIVFFHFVKVSCQKSTSSADVNCLDDFVLNDLHVFRDM